MITSNTIKETCEHLGIPFKEGTLETETAKMQRNNAWEGEADKNFVVPVLKLSVYVDEEIQKLGIAKLTKSLGHWLVVCEIHKGHSQDYITHPVTKKRMVRYSYFVPQHLIPDMQGYIPTVAQLKKITNPNEREPLKYGFLIYKPATASTKKKVKERQ